MKKHGIKRLPVYFDPPSAPSGDYSRYMRLSKADWADVYVDLYWQVFGQEATTDAILSDVERRINLLKMQGIR